MSDEPLLAQYQSIIVGSIGFFGVIISILYNGKKARDLRWWERKLSAYEAIIEALYKSKNFTSQHLGALFNNKEVSEERDKDLRIQAKAGHEEIEKAISVGAFFLSEEAAARLREYKKQEADAKEAESWLEYLDADYAATESCLRDFVQIAKKDLALGKR